MLQCLAIVTFVGASSPDEVQLSMKYIWETCNSADSTHTVLPAALSAWSFLLSAIDGWRIHSEYWKGYTESNQFIFVMSILSLNLFNYTLMQVYFVPFDFIGKRSAFSLCGCC